MRLILTSLTLVTLLAGCGPSQMAGQNPALAGSTGYFDRDHIDFIHNGDAYVVKRQQEIEANPVAQTKTTAATPTPSLNSRIKQFELSRYNADQPEVAVLFGAAKYRLTVFFTDASPAIFTGALDAKLQFVATTAGLKLEGSFRDYRSAGAPPYLGLDRSSAVIYLTELKTKERLEISYRALKKKPSVYRTRKQTLAPALERKVEQIEKTSAWENNWTIIGGKSFLLNDFILPGRTTTNESLLSFQVESKRTSSETEAHTFAAESLSPTTAPQVTMVGNSEKSGMRAYQVAIADPSTRDTTEILVTTAPEFSDPADVTDDKADLAPGSTEAKAPPLPPQRPAEYKPRNQFRPRTVNGPYLPIHTELKYTGRLDADLQKNFGLAGVKKFLRAYMGPERSRLQNFFDHAYYFRSLMSLIAQAFDAHPIAFYLTVDESRYFTGGKYEIERGDGGLALGPGQLHKEAAHEGGLVVGGRIDERRYFAPSGCAIARYVNKLTKGFAEDDMDTTLTLAGYNQGATGARNLAGKFGVSWRVLDETRSGLPDNVRKYVDSKIAIYFIANDRAAYGFPLETKRESHAYPTNGTLVPPQGITNATCRAVVAQAFPNAPALR